MKSRVDDLLVARGLAESKAKAQALIMAGKVHSGTLRIDKAGKKIPDDTPLTVESPPRFVSRGGEKLEGFLKIIPQVKVAGAVCLDVGACTGGFTDCLLQHGAAQVVAIDVGRAQLHEKMKRDPRVTSIESLNARNMSASDLPVALYDIIVMDVAFISQKKVLENVWSFLKSGGTLISLIKPQFEITKEEADKCQGVIKDPVLRDRVVAEVREFVATNLQGATEIGFAPSEVVGAEGNQEYLVGVAKD